MRVLIAEDERTLNRMITKTLIHEGYTADSCYDGEEALDYLKMGEFDVAILDIMMPKLSGIEVLKTIRAEGISVPVIFLTARDSIEDRVKGLDAGAQDYLVKPFAFEELLARLRAIIRKNAGNDTNVFSVGNLVLDTKQKNVTRGGRQIALTAKEYEILEYMVLNKGVILPREKIENHVWNFDYCGGTNLVDVYIRYLRKKIDDEYDEKLIHTVRGVGYVVRGG